MHLLNWSVDLKLPPQFGLGRVIVNPGDEERLVGVSGGGFIVMGVPESDFLLQLVLHLFRFLPALPLQSLLPRLYSGRWGGVLRVLIGEGEGEGMLG